MSIRQVPVPQQRESCMVQKLSLKGGNQNSTSQSPPHPDSHECCKGITKTKLQKFA
jgi:hypothetical protein